MRILVIEDKELNCKSAQATLSDHELTVVKSFDEAMEFLKERTDDENVERLLVEAGFPTMPDSKDEERRKDYWETWSKARAKSVIPFSFEVVLTDMMLPMSKKTLAPGVFKSLEQVPYGFIIALKAALLGAKFVAMVTDTNHHLGAMSAAIDHLGAPYYNVGCKPNFVINDAKVMFVHTPFTDVSGTTCPECKGADQRCHVCKNEGTDRGKDWGQVLTDLIG